jgi:hypothetical protein
MPGQASEQPLSQQPSAAASARVSERLAAIREAFSVVTSTPDQHGVQQAQWWGNGWPNWRNWRNWGNGWHNGGWGNWWR